MLVHLLFDIGEQSHQDNNTFSFNPSENAKKRKLLLTNHLDIVCASSKNVWPYLCSLRRMM